MTYKQSATQLCLLSGLLAGHCLTSAHADVDPFEFQVYTYKTQGQGKFDPQLLSSFIASGHAQGQGGTSPTYASQNMWRYALELEYGLTDKIDFAYYLNVAKPDGADLQYTGSKFRFRGRIAEQGELPIDLGWYSEIEWWSNKFNDDQVEAEFMTTMQKDIDKWTIIINAPDIDKVFIGDNRREVFEIGWRGEASYQITEGTRLGLQVYGSPGKVNDVTPVGQQQHYVVPTVHTVLLDTFRSSLGLGFGLTEGSDLFFLKANIHFDANKTEKVYD
ncbi:hypothetical protein KEF85_05675 [Methylomonas paludis]|uniref:Uncharacterized protein n=1 Tax=Methylomonas paludis TaxID=1173101 RepID=A0A975MQ57_9GAMM|nr:hypothetical protein [Methylomonas paludis]QWF71947.1 hypothetical protein KEF85_05675 [Methylomonas paludis]